MTGSPAHWSTTSTGWHIGSSPAARRCSPHASSIDASSTGTATCWPTTSSAPIRARYCWTAWNSTTACDTSMSSTTRRSWPWTWSSSADPISPISSSRATGARAQRRRPAALVDFYIAYRAVVRAKVDVIRALQGDSNGWDRACRHLELALRRLRAGAVQLIVIGGGPGTGKTTLARGLAEHIECTGHFHRRVRRELAAAGVIGGRRATTVRLYSPEQVAVVYDTVLRKAAESLATGVSVILDGTWRDPGQRRRAREIARRVEFSDHRTGLHGGVGRGPGTYQRSGRG